MKFYQSGRSMVEMLGVLAIIGVLSVGAIAGYSKAMMKYKLNKYASDITLMLAELHSLMRGDNDLSGIDVKYFVPENLLHTEVRKTSFTDYFYNRWGINNYGLFVRIGGDADTGTSSSRLETIKSTCQIIFQSTVEANLKDVIIFFPGGNLQICNDSCQTKFSDLNVTTIGDICKTIAMAQNSDAIMYFHF